MKLKRFAVTVLTASLISSVFAAPAYAGELSVGVANLGTDFTSGLAPLMPVQESGPMADPEQSPVKFNELLDLQALAIQAPYVPITTAADLRAELIEEAMMSAKELAAKRERDSVLGTIGIVNVSRSLNVRDAAGTDSNIVGKIYQNSGVIIGNFAGKDDEWTYVTSGSTRGWVSSKYIVSGELSKSFYDVIEPSVATSVCEAKAYAGPDKESDLMCSFEKGAQFTVLGYEGDYVKVQLTAASDGYIHSEFVAVSDGLFAGVNLVSEEKYQDEIDALEKEREEEAERRRQEEEKAKQKAKQKKSGSTSKSGGSSKTSGSSKSGNSDSETTEGWKHLGKFRVTFYCVECNSPAGSRKTYSGATAKEWHTCAVSTSQIKMGTTLKVSGFGEFVAEDTGVGINQIDLFVNPGECDGLYYRDVWVKN